MNGWMDGGTDCSGGGCDAGVDRDGVVSEVMGVYLSFLLSIII
jgi:hypothetical protein